MDDVLSDWKERAACKKVGARTMYPAPNDTVGLRSALALCSVCPVRTDCLRQAIIDGETHGVWGGTTARRRARIVKYLKKSGEPLEAIFGTLFKA